MTATAKQGNTVKVEYTGKLDTGETFDSSKGREPLEFEIGAHKVIKGFEDGVVGMKVGDKKKITIAPEQGYGVRHEQYIKELPRKSVPESLELKEGMLLMFKREDGMSIPATVVKIGKDEISVDFNHPLAGETLMFDVELLEIK